MTRRSRSVALLCSIAALLSCAQIHAQTAGVCPVANATSVHSEARDHFLKSIDADAWSELQRDAANGACLFGQFSLGDSYAAFQAQREAYLQESQAKAKPIQPTEPDHAGLVASPLPLSTVAPASASTSATTAAMTPFWTLGLNAPEQMINGTQSSQSFGGNFGFSVRDTSGNYGLDFAADGTHTRSWKAASASIETDATDVDFKASRAFKQNYAVYGTGEGFFNTSLGLALEQSYGGGFSYSVPIPVASGSKNRWSYSGAVESRFYNERLYNTATPLHLAGLRFEQQFAYRRAAEDDRLKLDKYVLRGHVWVADMLNNQRAVQGFADLAISFPIRRSFCVSIGEEDDYLNNVPVGFERNYLSSKVTLSIAHGSSPSNRCY